MISPGTFDNFESASKAVLDYLHRRFGFTLWVVTRAEKEDWVILQAKDNAYGIKQGAVFRWADTFCSQMVSGKGPRVACRAEEIPAYAAAPISKQFRIGAYIGIPLAREDGSLFGTLCALDPAEQPQLSEEALAEVELLAKLLATLLDFDLKAAEQQRRLQQLLDESLTDPLTGLHNRRSWDQKLEEEEARARRFGSPACILVVDLDNLKYINDTFGHAQGDALIRRTATCLKTALRDIDVAARLGGDEFAILAIECGPAGAHELVTRVRKTLSSAGISASVGKALRDPQEGLFKAWQKADQAMYAVKAMRRSERAGTQVTN